MNPLTTSDRLLFGGSRLVLEDTMPTRVGTSTGWKDVSAGGDCFLALKRDGSLWVWDYFASTTDVRSWAWTGDKGEALLACIGAGADWKTVSCPLVIRDDGSLWEFDSRTWQTSHIKE